MRYTYAALAVAVLLGGCSSSESDTPATTPPPDTVATTTTTTSTTTTTVPTTTTTQPTTTTLSEEEVAEQQFEADLVLIKQMWRRYSDSWSSGVEAGYETAAKYNHPLNQCTADEFKDWLRLPEGWEEEIIIDQDSVERDDEWPIPGTGIGDGEVPDGRIYIMAAKIIWNEPGKLPTTQEAEIHATVNFQTPNFFMVCRDD